jgi:hypothetical protein
VQRYKKNEPNVDFNCFNAILFSVAVCQILLFFRVVLLLSCNGWAVGGYLRFPPCGLHLSARLTPNCLLCTVFSSSVCLFISQVNNTCVKRFCFKQFPICFFWFVRKQRKSFSYYLRGIIVIIILSNSPSLIKVVISCPPPISQMSFSVFFFKSVTKSFKFSVKV